MSIEDDVRRFREGLQALEAEVGKVIVGHGDVVRQVIVAIVAGGHVLLEGVPGIGKTLLVRTLAQCLRLSFSRIQFTPDLMPSDVIGTNIVADTPDGRKEFRFQRGPVFGNLILADEVNRATPKTQSALLEAMQEKSVTVSGRSYKLEEPFFVLATQNPIKMEGTYPLPEAQVDRFLFKVAVPHSPPSVDTTWWNWTVLDDERVHPVSERHVTQAVEMLEAREFLRLTEEEASRLLGRRLPPREGAIICLLRGVALNREYGVFTVHVNEGDVLVHHGNLGHKPLPMTRLPVVGQLARIPQRVFCSCSMAE
jgi:MoxR-like ATPase